MGFMWRATPRIRYAIEIVKVEVQAYLTIRLAASARPVPPRNKESITITDRVASVRNKTDSTLAT